MAYYVRLEDTPVPSRYLGVQETSGPAPSPLPGERIRQLPDNNWWQRFMMRIDIPTNVAIWVDDSHQNPKQWKITFTPLDPGDLAT